MITESILGNTIVKPYYRTRGWFVYTIDYKRVPDLYLTKHGEVIWIELKVLLRVSPDGLVKPKWRLGQLAWIAEQVIKGHTSNVMLAVYIDKENTCRLYRECKKVYTDTDLYDTLGGI